jgi:hypothetical protein
MLTFTRLYGNTSITTNVGSLRNYGWEFDISSLNISSDKLQWSTSLNLTFEKNKITELTQESFINGTKRWEVGSSLYDFFLVQWAGVDAKTGMGTWWYDKKDTQGGVTRKTTNYIWPMRKLANYMGSSLPKFRGGFTNYFKYAKFRFECLI